MSGGASATRVDEAGWTSYAAFQALAKVRGIQAPQIWEGTKGGSQTAIRELNLEVRPLLDELITEKATSYIKRVAASGQAVLHLRFLVPHASPRKPYTLISTQTSPDRLGGYTDAIAEMDYRVGQIVDSVEEAGIADNTIVVFSSDNAAGDIAAMQGGSNGPWRGNFFTPPTEGSMRVPAIIRMPGTVPSGVITEELLTAHDWYRTFATLAGASDRVPSDRPLDGIDASDFLRGDQDHTGRDFVVFFGPDGSLMSVKWHNVKMWLRYSEGPDTPIVQPQMPLGFDLGSDPGEKYKLFSVKMDMGWMIGIAIGAVSEYEKSIGQYPNIKPGQDFSGYS